MPNKTNKQKKTRITFEYLAAYKGVNDLLRKVDMVREFVGVKYSGEFTTTTRVDEKYIKKMRGVLKQALELDPDVEISMMELHVGYQSN